MLHCEKRGENVDDTDGRLTDNTRRINTDSEQLSDKTQTATKPATVVETPIVRSDRVQGTVHHLLQLFHLVIHFRFRTLPTIIIMS